MTDTVRDGRQQKEVQREREAFTLLSERGDKSKYEGLLASDWTENRNTAQQAKPRFCPGAQTSHP